MQSFYSRLYSGVYANNDDKNFNTVRLALGGLTDVACDESQTMILQSDVQNGKGVSLTIYSKADEVYIDGSKLEKDGKPLYLRAYACRRGKFRNGKDRQGRYGKSVSLFASV